MIEKNKKIIKITALGLCAAVFTVAVLAFLIFPRTSRSGVQVETPSNIGGMTVGESDGNAVSLAAVEISPENFADYGIMPIAENAYTLTATVNDDATVKAVDWTIEFQNPASEWATGKTVTDYVSFTSKGDLTATVACSQAFGEPILVSAVSKDDPAVKATCTCDYQKKIIGIDFEAQSDVSEHSISQKSALVGSNLGKIYFGETYSFTVKAVYGVGTVGFSGEKTFFAMNLSIPSESVSELSKKGFDREPSEIVGSMVSFFLPQKTFDDQVVSELFGPGALTNSKALVDAVKALNGEYPNLIKVIVFFATENDDVVNPDCVFYLDVDADSLYKSVVNVQLDPENVLF